MAIIVLMKGLIFFLVFACAGFCTPPGFTQVTIPSGEEFVNKIFHSIVDSSWSTYYLSNQAAPCSFVKLDYDEWVKYALKETVTMDLLNELAERSWHDRKPLSWRQDLLKNAVCIGEKKTDSLLDPALGLRQSGSSVRKRKKAIHQLFVKWSAEPPAQRTVFFFSRPLFTQDGQYAIIDLNYRCDAQQWGSASTCLFRREGSDWKLIGRKMH